MKLGLMAALAVAVIWSLIAIAQVWVQPLPADIFLKLTLTAAILVVIIVVVTLALREYFSEKKLKDDGFIDG